MSKFKELDFRSGFHYATISVATGNKQAATSVGRQITPLWKTINCRTSCGVWWTVTVGRRDTLRRFTHTQKCDQQQTASTLPSSPSLLLPFTSSTVTNINACKTHSYLRLQDRHHCRHMHSVTSKSTDVITLITIFLPSPANSIIIICVTTTISLSLCRIESFAFSVIIMWWRWPRP
jgi:hypothetical protein